MSSSNDDSSVDNRASADETVTTSGIVETLRAAGCVFAEDEAALLLTSADGPADLADMVARRTAGIPLEHILGWAEFCGHRIAVEDGVFVPRHRTEFLVELATGLARQAAAAHLARAVGPAADLARAVVVDLCCGSGALGLVVARLAAQVELYAADIDPAAARCARRNVALAGGQVFEGDLYDPLPADLRGRVDVLIANAPYVPTEEIALMPPEAREYEPLVALDGGPDGLDVLRRVIAGASAWLASGGHLLVETSISQAPVLAGVAGRHGLTARVEGSDDYEATVLIVTRPGAAGR
ncbi:hypothetical protein BCD49_27900 [Pseudofrankia sp. EUN1h]|nr:putative protein N(5)-glutamine methyltransferase [Pseudofrankia saprophytica]OHV32962.1 hypothetical protein BCD49_27900 [Pseudofrankia sp. EUN1h]